MLRHNLCLIWLPTWIAGICIDFEHAQVFVQVNASQTVCFGYLMQILTSCLSELDFINNTKLEKFLCIHELFVATVIVKTVIII